MTLLIINILSFILLSSTTMLSPIYRNFKMQLDNFPNYHIFIRDGISMTSPDPERSNIDADFTQVIVFDMSKLKYKVIPLTLQWEFAPVISGRMFFCKSETFRGKEKSLIDLLQLPYRFVDIEWIGESIRYGNDIYNFVLEGSIYIDWLIHPYIPKYKTSNKVYLCLNNFKLGGSTKLQRTIKATNSSSLFLTETFSSQGGIHNFQNFDILDPEELVTVANGLLEREYIYDNEHTVGIQNINPNPPLYEDVIAMAPLVAVGAYDSELQSHEEEISTHRPVGIQNPNPNLPSYEDVIAMDPSVAVGAYDSRPPSYEDLHNFTGDDSQVDNIQSASESREG